MSKKLFLHLNEPDHAKAWIEGGRVPLFNSEKYLSMRRKGTDTQDEGFFQTFHQLSKKNVDHLGSTIFGSVEIYAKSVILLDNEKAEYFARIPYGGIIFCLSRVGTREQSLRFKKNTCVEIVVDPRELLSQISIQLHLPGMMGDCTYTETTERGPFIKFVEDSWQQEFRMFWPTKLNEVSIEIRPGTAKRVTY